MRAKEIGRLSSLSRIGVWFRLNPAKKVLPGVFIKRLIEKVKSRARRRDTITTLELRNGYIEIIEVLRTSEGSRLRKLAAEKIFHQDGEETSKLLRNFSRKLNTNGHNLVTSIPRHSSIVKFVRLPSSREEEIEQMVAFQVINEAPYNEKEMTYDYQVVRSTPDGYSDVMIAIVPNQVIDEHMGLLRDAGLNPGSVRLDSEVIYSLYLHKLGVKEDLEQETLGLIDIGRCYANILVIYQGSLVFTRSFPMEVTDGEAASGEKSEGKLIDEVIRTLAAFQMSNRNMQLTKIVISGGTMPRSKLERKLGQDFPVPIELMDPLSGFELSPELQKQLQKEGEELSFATAVGLTLEIPGKRINLLPKEIQAKRRNREKFRDLAKLAGLLAYTVAIIVVLVHTKLEKKREYIQYLDSQIETTMLPAERTKQMMEEINIVRSQLNVGMSALDVLGELYSIIPAEISLNLLSFEEDEAILLKGTSPTMAGVLDLVPKLENVDIFKNVSTKHVSKRTAERKDYVTFEIQLYLEGPR